MTKLLLMVGASLTAFVPALAQAQATNKAEVIGLSEIIVTAQKRSENLQDAAIAVSAVDGSQIADAGVTNSLDLTKLVPALQVGTATGAFTSYFIRGVGKVTVTHSVDSAILVNLDGVSLARSTTSAGGFYDLERVEVLKGPQGTLYGRNATGGAINIITRKPTFDDFGGFLEAEVGNYDAYRAAGAVNIPINDWLAIRAAGQVVRRDGYLSDGTYDDESEAGRIQASIKFSDTATLLLSGDYSHTGGKGPGGVLVPFIDPNDRLVGLLDPRTFPRYNTTLVPFAGNFLPAPPTDSFMDSVNWGVHAQLDVGTPIGTLTLLPAYRESKPEYRATASQVADYDEESSQTSLEARLTSDDDQALKYVFGLYYLDEEIQTEANFNQGFNASIRFNNMPNTSSAAFARLNYSITDQFRIDGGVRYTKDEKSIATSGFNLRVVCPAGPTACIGGPAVPYTREPLALIFAPNGSVIPAQPYGTRGNVLVAGTVRNSASGDFTSTTYHLGLEYDVTERSLLYLTYDTGYKAGGFFATVPQDPAAFEPEEVEAYTLGSKNRFLDNRLQLNMEIFHWKYSDQQVSFLSVDSLGGNTLRIANVGQSTLRGAEVEAQWAAAENTLLSANIQYLDAKNDLFVYRTVVPPTTGCPVTVDGRFFVVNCSGTRPMLTSEWTLNFAAEQTFPLGNSGEIVANLSTRFQSAFNAGFELLPRQKQNGYWTTDASLTYNAPEDRYFVTAFVRNIEDDTPFATAAAMTQTNAFFQASLRPPRTYGVRAGVKF